MSSFDYQKSTLTKYRSGSANDPYIDITETKTVVNGQILLNEIPVQLNKVKIDGMFETPSTNKNVLKANEYRVDYSEGIISFHESAENTQKTYSYKGRGNHYVSATRIWTEEHDGNVVKTLKDAVDASNEAIVKVENLDKVIAEAEVVKQEMKDATDYTIEKSIQANESALYATGQGDYAKLQGNYAKEQGDYAKAQGNDAKEQTNIAIEVIGVANDKIYKMEESTKASNQKLVELESARLDTVAATEDARIETERASTEADYAKEQGTFAKEQGDYALTQGNFAKEQGNYAKEQGNFAKEEAENAVNVTKLGNEKIVELDESIQRSNNKINELETERLKAVEATETTIEQGNKAALEADTAKLHGEYARQQGDYAKLQGEYAEEQGAYALEQATSTKDFLIEANNKVAELDTALTKANDRIAETEEAITETNASSGYAKEQGDFAKEQGEFSKSVADSLVHKGNYSETVTYENRNIVYYKGATFMCVANSLGNEPTNSNYWKRITNLTWQGEYISTTTYNFGDVVTDETKKSIYMCIVEGSVGIDPSVESNWDLLMSVQDSVDIVENLIVEINEVKRLANIATTEANLAAAQAMEYAEDAEAQGKYAKEQGDYAKQETEIIIQKGTSLVNKGTYKNDETYKPLNIVVYESGVYQNIAESLGIIPTESSHWQLLMQTTSSVTWDSIAGRPDVETVEGSKNKADQAEENAKAYADTKQTVIKLANNFADPSGVIALYPEGYSVFYVGGGTGGKGSAWKVASGSSEAFGYVETVRIGAGGYQTFTEMYSGTDSENVVGNKQYKRNKRDSNTFWQPFERVLDVDDYNTISSKANTYTDSKFSEVAKVIESLQPIIVTETEPADAENNTVWFNFKKFSRNIGTKEQPEWLEIRLDQGIGDLSHVEGEETVAVGKASHAEGHYTRANVGFDKLTSIAVNTEPYTIEVSDGSRFRVGDIIELLHNGDTITAKVLEVTENVVTIDQKPEFIESAMPVPFPAESEVFNLSWAKNYEAYGHSEGYKTYAIGIASHAEGQQSQAKGQGSHAEGFATKSSGYSSHAEGNQSISSGDNSHAEGFKTISSGVTSHSEGNQTKAEGDNSHAEGFLTIASGLNSHAEGEGSIARGTASHSEGKARDTAYQNSIKIKSYNGDESSFTVSGDFSNYNQPLLRVGNIPFTVTSKSYLADTNETKYLGKFRSKPTVAPTIVETSSGSQPFPEDHPDLVSAIFPSYAHGEGSGITGADFSHAEGELAEAKGKASHAEGSQTIASGMNSHAEGQYTKAIGHSSHAEGYSTTSSGFYSHTEGEGTIASGKSSHAEGRGTLIRGDFGHVEGTSTSDGGNEVTIKIDSIDSSNSFNVKGDMTSLHQMDVWVIDEFNFLSNFLVYDKVYDNVRGLTTYSGSYMSSPTGSPLKVMTAERNESFPLNHPDFVEAKFPENVHAEGDTTIAAGSASHTEGKNTRTQGQASHAEGNGSKAFGHASHAEGKNTKSIGDASHAEGENTEAWANNSHVEGFGTKAEAPSAHAEGSLSIAQGQSSHAEGQETFASGSASHAEGFRTISSGNYAHTEGFLSSTSYRVIGISIIDVPNRTFTFTSGKDLTPFAVGDEVYVTWKDSTTPYVRYLETTIINIDLNARSITFKDNLPIPTVAPWNIQSRTYGGVFKKATTTKGNISHAEGYQTLASGDYTHAEGNQTTASGEVSHAEGLRTVSSGISSHAEGQETTASGSASHAEGYITVASGSNSHAEGQETTASGGQSHAEGKGTKATTFYAHAEGYQTLASNTSAHAEGTGTTASGSASHAEGNMSQAISDASHAEGFRTTASSIGAHSEGNQTTASGSASHAEGFLTKASRTASHAEGQETTASGGGSHSEGISTQSRTKAAHAEGFRTFASRGAKVAGIYQEEDNIIVLEFIPNGTNFQTDDEIMLCYIENDGVTSKEFVTQVLSISSLQLRVNALPANIGETAGMIVINLSSDPDQITGGAHAEGVYTLAAGTSASHAEGIRTVAGGIASHAEGSDTQAIGDNSHAEGSSSRAIGNASHVEGNQTTASGSASHAEGYLTTASGNSAHSEGTSTKAEGENSHTEGVSTRAVGKNSHAEGQSSFASGESSHAEGRSTTASGNFSHAEGSSTRAGGQSSHAEGQSTQANASYSHAEGYESIAGGLYAHAEGQNTQANASSSHAAGTYTTVNATYTGAWIMGAYGDAKESYSWHLANGTNVTTRGLAARISSQGGMYTTKAYSTGGADYAEMFEWEDDNKNNEDRVGYFVTLVDDKIRIANSNDSYILGIVSADPSVIGDNQDLHWKGRFLRDEWDRIRYQMVDVPAMYDQVPSGEDNDGNEIYETVEISPARKERQPMLNPEWDADQYYARRELRPEWSAVGMMGKLLVRDDGTGTVNGFVMPNDQGIATKSDDGYRVMKRISESIIQILVK